MIYMNLAAAGVAYLVAGVEAAIAVFVVMTVMNYRAFKPE